MNNELSSLIDMLADSDKKLIALNNEAIDHERSVITEVTNKMRDEKISPFGHTVSVIIDEETYPQMVYSHFEWDGQKWFHYETNEEYIHPEAKYEMKPVLSETVGNRSFFVRQLPAILAAGYKEKLAKLKSIDEKMASHLKESI